MKKLLLLSTILMLLSVGAFAQQTEDAAPGATLCADDRNAEQADIAVSDSEGSDASGSNVENSGN